LSWVKLGNGDNYNALKHIDWQIHVYGTAQAKLKARCEHRNIRLQNYPWQYAKFGDALLLSLDEVMFEDGTATRGDTVSRGLWD
jgi:hypothetical protein